MNNHKKHEIASIVFEISSDQPIESIRFEPEYKDFISKKKPDVTVCAHYDTIPNISLKEENIVFDSGGVWSLYMINGKHVFVLKSPVSGPLPYRIAIFNSDFLQGNVYSRVLKLENPPDDLLPNPIEYPLSEVLMLCLLAQGRGMMAHACGIEDNGKGYLFAGNSTHGKTTMARLWKDRALVLNDDRIVLRQRDGRFWMYGTPWHGDYTGVSPQGILLDKIFFLRHAQKNRALHVEGSTAASMLLTRSFLPLWHAKGMRFTLDFCAKLVDSISCFELGFVPDKKILNFVRCVK
jgi:hypothetical protein